MLARAALARAEQRTGARSVLPLGSTTEPSGPGTVTLVPDLSAVPVEQPTAGIITSERPPMAVPPPLAPILPEGLRRAQAAADDARRGLDELRQANDLVHRHSEQVERATAMHERLHGVMLTGGGLPEVAAVTEELLGGDLAVLDAAGLEVVVVGDREVAADGWPGRRITLDARVDTAAAPSRQDVMDTTHEMPPSPSERETARAVAVIGEDQA